MSARPAILVIEDDLDARDALAGLLTAAGYEVSIAEDGREAADLLLHGFRPELMVVDLMLPNVSGSEFLRYVQDDPDLRAIPRIVVTAMPQEHVHVVADVIMFKPCDFQELLASIVRIVPPR